MKLLLVAAICLASTDPSSVGLSQGNADKLGPVTYYGKVVNGQVELNLWPDSRIWVNSVRIPTRETSEEPEIAPQVTLRVGDVLTSAPGLRTRYEGLPKEGRLFTQLKLERTRDQHAWFIISKHTAIAEPLADGSTRYRIGRLISSVSYEIDLQYALIDGEPVPGVLAGWTKSSGTKR